MEYKQLFFSLAGSGANKKAVSTALATILVILITIAAATLLMQFILPFVNDKLNSSSECLNYKNYFQFEEKFVSSNGVKKYNCYANTLNSLGGEQLQVGASIKAAQIESSDTAKVDGMKLIFSRASSSEAITIINGTDSSGVLSMYKKQKIPAVKLIVPQSGELVTYVFNSSGANINLVSEPNPTLEVYPILKSGRVCDITDRIALEPCIGGINLKDLS